MNDQDILSLEAQFCSWGDADFSMTTRGRPIWTSKWPPPPRALAIGTRGSSKP